MFSTLGFLEKEIRKDGIPMLDTGENPDAPAPREMIDLEVCRLCSNVYRQDTHHVHVMILQCDRRSLYNSIQMLL